MSEHENQRLPLAADVTIDVRAADKASFFGAFVRRTRVTIVVALLLAGLLAAIGTTLGNWTGFGFKPRNDRAAQKR
jgi:hypothetical protein